MEKYNQFIFDTSYQTTQDLINFYNLDWLAPILQELKVCLCGGALISFYNKESAEDLDLYLPSGSAIEPLKLFIESYKFSILYSTNNAITYEPKNISENKLFKNYKTIQIIKNPLFTTNGTQDGAMRLLNGFDFRVCMAGYSFYSQKMMKDIRFDFDRTSKQIHFNPACSGRDAIPIRLYKYLTRGYGISYANFISMYLTYIEYVAKKGITEETTKRLTLMSSIKEKVREGDFTNIKYELKLADLYK